MKRIKLFSVLALAFFATVAQAQWSPDYKGGLVAKLNDDGSKFVRFLFWGQGQYNYNEDAGPGGVGTGNGFHSLSIKRARVLAYAQINKEFMLVAHFGTNNINSSTETPTGTSNANSSNPAIFFHDFWLEYNIVPEVQAGVGLHYWGGISRLNNQGTINMMTLDNDRATWPLIGLSEQFASQLGVYFKGKFDKFEYRLSISDALKNNTDAGLVTAGSVATRPSLYVGKSYVPGEAKLTYAGYLEYNIFDGESNLLPFKVGSYLGAKKILNIGAGFFYHPSGIVELSGTTTSFATATKTVKDASIFAFDVFYDAPLTDSNDAITAYALYQNSDFGNNYIAGGVRTNATYGTGSLFYSHLGYLIGAAKETKNRFQPYVSYSHRAWKYGQDWEGKDAAHRVFGIGANWYIDGHNAKISAEYQKALHRAENLDDTFTIQAQIVL